ncbi:MAG: Kdo hydroxylase family protein [Steroidobacteraceae bacterium]
MLLNISKQRLEGIGRHEIGDALERGDIVHFPECPIPLMDQADLTTLREQLPRQLHTKNVSYHPESDHVHGTPDNGPLRDLAHRVLKAHGERVVGFLERVIPDLCVGMTIGTSSFRPIQEQGRNLKPHASNELVHIDAGAYGATNGDRILRFFVNVNASVDRVWATKGTFPHLFDRYAAAAGITGKHDLDKTILDRLRGGALRGLVRAGIKEAMVVDSSPYDRLMRRFHNYMKDTPAFQAPADDREEIRFRPFSAWMVFTDTTSHASISGQHALVNTFLIRLAACRLQAVAPINILRAGGVAA